MGCIDTYYLTAHPFLFLVPLSFSGIDLVRFMEKTLQELYTPTVIAARMDPSPYLAWQLSSFIWILLIPQWPWHLFQSHSAQLSQGFLPSLLGTPCLLLDFRLFSYPQPQISNDFRKNYNFVVYQNFTCWKGWWSLQFSISRVEAELDVINMKSSPVSSP